MKFSRILIILNITFLNSCAGFQNSLNEQLQKGLIEIQNSNCPVELQENSKKDSTKFNLDELQFYFQLINGDKAVTLINPQEMEFSKNTILHLDKITDLKENIIKAEILELTLSTETNSILSGKWELNFCETPNPLQNENLILTVSFSLEKLILEAKFNLRSLS